MARTEPTSIMSIAKEKVSACLVSGPPFKTSGAVHCTRGQLGALALQGEP